MSFRISMVALAVVILTGDEHVKPQTTGSYNGFDLVDNAGNIRKPADFRDVYQILGTYLVLDQKGDQMHMTK